jgi:hypothetical protein
MESFPWSTKAFPRAISHSLPRDDLVFYRDSAKKNERIGAMLDRIGVDELKKAVCG